jgi:hypothetical protein
VSVAVAQLRAGHVERLAGGAVSLARPSSSRLGAGAGPRRFDAVAYSGVEVGRSFGRMVVKTSGIQRAKKTGMLLEHDDNSGVAVADDHAANPDGTLRLSGYFLDDVASRGEASALVAKMDQGFPIKMSIGIRFLEHHFVDEGQEEEVNGRTVDGPIVVVDESFLFETSFIHVNPADLATSTQVSRSTGAATRTSATDAKKGPVLRSPEALKRAREDWLTQVAATIVLPAINRAGLVDARMVAAGNRPKRYFVVVGECETPTRLGECRYSDDGHEALVVVSPKVRGTREAVLVLAHELLHVVIPRWADHGTDEWKRASRLVGLEEDGYANGKGTLELASRARAQVGAFPR